MTGSARDRVLIAYSYLLTSALDIQIVEATAPIPAKVCQTMKTQVYSRPTQGAFRTGVDLFLIHDLLFLPIFTIESAVGKRLLLYLRPR